MTEDLARPALERIEGILKKHASTESHLPAGLGQQILLHEHAVQFDDTRYEAGGYLRGLVNEALDKELGHG